MIFVRDYEDGRTAVEMRGTMLDLICETASTIQGLHQKIENDFDKETADEMIVLVGRMAMANGLDDESGKEFAEKIDEILKKGAKRDPLKFIESMVKK